MSHRDRIERYLALGYTVSGGKGSQDVGSAENAQVDLQKELQTAFQTQFGKSEGVLNFLNSTLTGQIEHPTGFSAPMLSALNTQATTGVAQNFQAANTATNELEAEHGGNGLPSGVQAQLTAANANQAAQSESAAQTGIGVANAQQQQQNYWNAVSGEGAVGQGYNPLGFSSAATGAGESVAGLSNAQTAANNSGFGGAFMSGLGNVLSGNSFASGFGKSLG